MLCHANVARSVAAVHLLGGTVDERGVPLELASAGTHAAEGQPVSSRTQLALGAVLGHAVDLGRHRAHLLGASDLAEADLIVTMEASQVLYVRRGAASAADRTATLSVLARELPAQPVPLRERIASMGLAARTYDGGGDVDDPAGGEEEAYVRAMTTLAAMCAELAARLAG